MFLGWIQAIHRIEEFKEDKTDSIIYEAKAMLRDPEKFKQLEHVAEELNIGYSNFRKLFRSYTGLSPGQFKLQNQIKKLKSCCIKTISTIRKYFINQVLNPHNTSIESTRKKPVKRKEASGN